MTTNGAFSVSAVSLRIGWRAERERIVAFDGGQSGDGMKNGFVSLMAALSRSAPAGGGEETAVRPANVSAARRGRHRHQPYDTAPALQKMGTQEGVIAVEGERTISRGPAEAATLAMMRAVKDWFPIGSAPRNIQDPREDRDLVGTDGFRPAHELYLSQRRASSVSRTTAK